MISTANDEHYVWGGQCDGWYLVNRQDMVVIHEKMPTATAEIRHFHSVSRQFFFVLKGVLTLELEGTVHQLGIHQGVEIPPGAKHQARNDREENVEFLVISHPTTRGDRTDLL